MNLSLATTPANATSCDVLVLTAMPKGRGVTLMTHGVTAAQQSKILAALATLGATGKAGEVSKLGAMSGLKAKAVIVVGTGDSQKIGDAETYRQAIGSAVRACVGSRKVAVVADRDNAAEAALAAGLAAYDFRAFKSAPGKAPAPPAIVTIIVPAAQAESVRSKVSQVQPVVKAVHLARDLVNTPPNALFPADLAAAAKSAVAGQPVKVTVWDEKALKRDGCGGILAVGQGSSHPPRLVKLEYAPAGATAHLALVGKGITFDTGGISIKPAAGMDEMKGDMGGAAAVICAVKAIAELSLPLRVTGWVPTAENMPSGDAQRPGDVITMFDGTTVEVLNTDAEGRLVLADALGMAVKEHPDMLIDVATLTGAARVALGSRIAGVMSNDDSARSQVCAAAELVGEPSWPMPLPADLRPSLDSATADIANIGDRFGGMLSAGVFLQHFIPKGQAWVHIDIAGPSWNDKAAYGYTPKGGTGAAVRTFVQVANDLAAR